jgi:hypothetical protein
MRIMGSQTIVMARSCPAHALPLLLLLLLAATPSCARCVASLAVMKPGIFPSRLLADK